MMSQELIEAIKNIGYSEKSNLHPQDVEWAFEHEPTHPFLQWFCNSVGKQNILSEEEIEEFQNLKESGDVLEGAALHEALKLFTSTKPATSDSLRDDIERLKLSLEAAKEERHLLMKRCNKLSVHKMALQNKLAKTEDVGKHNLISCNQTGDRCRRENDKIAGTLQELMASIKVLTSLYQPTVNSKRGEGDGPSKGYFLSQMDLNAFHQAEEKFSHELTTFTKKQFFEGMADLAGGKEAISYSLLDTGSPSDVSVTGKDREQFEEDCRELQRLKLIYPQSECNRLNALVNARKAMSAVHEAKSILHQLRHGGFPAAPMEIGRLQINAEQSQEEARLEAEPLRAAAVDLIKQLGKYQDTEVLTGDYDLKLRRQDYFTKNQDKVTEYLFDQRSRNEFLSMMYELESRWHRETFQLLSVAKQILQKHLHEWEQRMNDLEDPDLSVTKFDRAVVDTRDISTTRLYRLMCDANSSEGEMYLPAQKVEDTAKALQQRHVSTKNTNKAQEDRYLQKMSQLESHVMDSNSKLSSQCGLTGGQPSLTPVDVQASLISVSMQMSALEEQITSLVTDIDNKKKALKTNLLQSKERELFRAFHTDPSRLSYLVDGLAERLKSEQIQQS